jgi:Spy/CpxP family protein refolding chaperone
MAPVIDRAALERLRAEQMQRMDVISRRILAAVEDAAEVLTPEQRAKFAEHLRQHMH